jgi:hypothetical protein
METASIDIELLIKRSNILKELETIAKQLKDFGVAHNVGDIKRLQFLKGAVYAYSVLLRGLQDSELEGLHLRLQKLEAYQLVAR